MAIFGGSLTDGSGTAGASAQVFPATVGRSFLFVQNVGDTNDLAVLIGEGDAAAAAGNIILAPGEHITFSGEGFVPTGRVAVFSVGTDFTALTA